MAYQEELQRVTDSTLQELAAIVEHHNQNYQDQEKAALREEIDKLKKEKDMKNEIRKSIEDSNQVLTREITEVALHSKIQKETKDHQIRRQEKSTAERVMEKEQATMFFDHAMDSCAKKEERYIRSIKRLNDYIHSLHSTLERSGIFNDRCTKQSEESDEYELDDSNNQFENNDNGNYDEFEKQSYDEESKEASNIVAETSVLESDEAVQVYHYSIVAANPQESNWCDMIEAEELELNQQSQLDEPDSTDLPDNELSCNDKDEESQESSNTVAETSVLESDDAVQLQVDKFSVVAANPQEPNWCDMIEAEELELNQQSQLDVPDSTDLAENEPNCKDKDKKSQEALNTEAKNSVLESDEPVKTEVLQIIKLDPFVHSYGEVKFEEVKKPKKKQQKRKPKPKSKFSTLTTFGRF